LLRGEKTSIHIIRFSHPAFGYAFDMETLKFKTNVNCSGCIANGTPHLNEIKGIGKWSVDTSNPMKVLTVETWDSILK